MQSLQPDASALANKDLQNRANLQSVYSPVLNSLLEGFDVGTVGKLSNMEGKAVTAVLPWMRVPISIEPGKGAPIVDVNAMQPQLRDALLSGSTQKGKHDKKAYTELFPVQSVVWEETAGGLISAHDLCIAAPTGSGKTLAYALPVINSLARLKAASSSQGVHRLRALVVLPTRDLAQQVAAVMEPLCSATGLNLQLVAAQTSLSAEADAIMGHTFHRATPSSLYPVSLDLLTRQPADQPMCLHDALSGAHAADILVATPGRLIAHLTGTPGFSLEGLRFLVIDETDRLLRQSYQEWLPQVMSGIHSNGQHCSTAYDNAIAHAAGVGHQHAGTTGPGLYRCVKLVVSATLTHDPSKLSRLMLHCPRYVAVVHSKAQHRYQLPKGLKEYRLPCSAARKPITLLALLQELKGQSCVVFASSLDTTHKLYLLLNAVLGSSHQHDGNDDVGQDQWQEIVECSGHKAAAAQRAAAIMRFKSGAAKVLVASDVVTRGMDFDGVQNVINYDAPVYAKTYVHRAGRTARAGKEGRVFTLLRDEDMKHFKSMLRKVDNTYVGTYKLPKGSADAQQPALSSALLQIAALLDAEAADDKARAAASKVTARRADA